MFGGLELKTPHSSSSEPEKKEAHVTSPPASSFSFLSSSASSTSAQPPPPSAFSFLASPAANDGAKMAKEPPTGFAFLNTPASAECPPAIDVSSGFSFLSPPATATAETETLPVSSSNSMFSFLSSTAAPPPLTEEVATPTIAPLTGMTQQNNEAMTKPPSWVVSSTMQNSSRSLGSDTNSEDVQAFCHQPAGAGVVFGGANKPRGVVKKRRPTQKVGLGPPGPDSPTTTQTVPLRQKQQAQQMSATTNDNAPHSNAVDNNEGEIESKQHNKLTVEAEEATRKAEQFMMEKTKSGIIPTTLVEDYGYNNSKNSDRFEPPSVSSVTTTKLSDTTYAQAKAAAEEVKRNAGSKMGGFMSGLFNRSNSSGSSSRLPSVITQNSSHHDNGVQQPEHVFPEQDPMSKLYREQEEAKRAEAQRELAALRQAQEREQEERLAAHRAEEEERRASEIKKEKERLEKLAAEERKRREEEEAVKRRTPLIALGSIVSEFRKKSFVATEKVNELRLQHSRLLAEEDAAGKIERLTTQKIAQAEAQQIAAAEAEDFDLADRLAEVIAEYEHHRDEQTLILDKVGGAMLELDGQMEKAVKSVAECFVEVQDKLTQFQKKQTLTERVDGSEAMMKFAATSKRLSTENDRLIVDLKNIERDEGFVKEERKGLEDTILEQTCDVEELRTTTCEKLKTVTNEIEELNKLLAAKEAEAAGLSADLAQHEATIAQVRTKFSRQITRVEKKEKAVKESRIEWEAEKVVFTKMKETHDSEVTAHSEALIAHDKIMDMVKSELTLAKKLEKIIAREIVIETEATSDKDGHLAKLQSEVLKCEAAVDDARLVFSSTQSSIDYLSEEIREISERLPVLEAEKKAAASQRDFKAASKASKGIREALTRKEKCKEELTGDALERMENAKTELEKVTTELSNKQEIANKKAKEIGLEKMAQLARKICRLERTKEEVSLEVDDLGKNTDSVTAVGRSVLDGEIATLRSKGEVLGADFGGWDDMVKKFSAVDKDLESSSDEDSVSEEALEVKAKASDVSHAEIESVDSEKNKEIVDEAPLVDAPDLEVVEGDLEASAENAILESQMERVNIAAVNRYKGTLEEMRILADALDKAAEDEDFDLASELDEKLNDVKMNLASMSLSDEELRLAVTSDEENDEDSEDHERKQFKDIADEVGSEELEHNEGNAVEADGDLL